MARPTATPDGSEQRIPDPRRTRPAILLAFLIQGTVSGTFASRVPWLREHDHLDEGSLGLALFALALGGLAAPLLGRRAVRRLSGPRGTACLLIGFACSLALPVLAANLFLLCAGCVAYGAAGALSDVAINAQGVAAEKRRGRSMMSGFHGAWSVGALLGSGAGAIAAAEDIDARVHFAATALVVIPLAMMTIPGLLERSGEGESGKTRQISLPSRPILLIGLIGFCAMFAEGGVAGWCAVFQTTVTGAGDGAAAVTYSAFAIAMAVGRLSGDRVVRVLGRTGAVRVSGVLGTAGCLLVVTSRSSLVCGFGFCLVGLGVAVVVPLAFAAAGRAGPTPADGAAGLVTVTYVAGLAAPAAIGQIADHGSLPIAFLLTTALVAAIPLGAGLLDDPARRT
ncbi:MFS transporter [Actinomadura sp. 9N215]|uniref:MFS transporter n=1 Tax=Actinomadura sp. 9N215 TaxID=3375150 RepID=UPI0037AE73D5